MKSRLGRQEAQMLAYLQMREQQIVRTGDLTGPLGLSTDQERELLRRMLRGGVIARVRPGLFLVPSQLPLGGAWSPDETLAITTLMEDRGAQYQVCGPNGFNHYGFDEQIPTETWAYNNRISGRRQIGAVRFNLIKVDDKRLGGTEIVRQPNGRELLISSRVRTLLDAVSDWSRFNSLPRGYDWIRNDLSAQRVSPQELVEMALRFGDIATRRRMGYLLESEGVPETQLQPLLDSISATTGPIPWDPTLPKRGRGNRRWGVVVNDGS